MLLLPAPLTPARTVMAKAALASAPRLAPLGGRRYRRPAELFRSGIEGRLDAALRRGPLHAGQQLVEAAFERPEPGLAGTGQVLEIVEGEDHRPRGVVPGDHDRTAGGRLVHDRAGGVLEAARRHGLEAAHLAARRAELQDYGHLEPS